MLDFCKNFGLFKVYFLSVFFVRRVKNEVSVFFATCMNYSTLLVDGNIVGCSFDVKQECLATDFSSFFCFSLFFRGLRAFQMLF